MVERIMVMLLVYGSIVLYDRPHLKNSSSRGEKTVYAILMIISLYFCIDYAANLNLPGLYEMIDLVFTDTARIIDKSLTVPKK